MSIRAYIIKIPTYDTKIPDSDKKSQKNLSKKVSPTISFLGITFHSDSIGPPFQRHFFSKFGPLRGLQVTFDPFLQLYPFNFFVIYRSWIWVFVLSNCPLLDQRGRQFLNHIRHLLKNQKRFWFFESLLKWRGSPIWAWGRWGSRAKSGAVQGFWRNFHSSFL